MPITPQNSLNGGEVSPRFYGRWDHEKYGSSVKILENVLNYQLGGGMFRPGTVYVNEIKDSNNPVDLIPFQYSSSVGYQIEVGAGYFRFYSVSDLARLESAGVPIEVVTPYAQPDLFSLHHVQKEDTMYIVKGNYRPKKLIRKTSTSFSLFDVPFVRGPFRDTNVDTDTTITPSSDTGATNLTITIIAWVTGTQYVVDDWRSNGGLTYRCVIPHTSDIFANDLAAGYWKEELFFKDTHVGSIWRIKSGVVKILTTAIAGLTATALVQAEPAGTAGNLATGPAASADWAEGAFSDYRGFPVTATFHEGRLYYFKERVAYGSVNFAYDNFASGVLDDDAVIFEVNSDQGDSIRWAKSNGDLLQIGTQNGTASISGGTNGITPTSIGVKFETDLGASPLMAQRISSFITYLQANTFNLRELVFNYVISKNQSADMNDNADHILRDGGGLISFDRQISPNQRLWGVRADGQMPVLTRNPEEKVKGWCRLIAGSTKAGAGEFESVSVNQRDGKDDLIWVIVKRNINGTVKRFVEYFSPEIFTNYWEAIRLDCSLTMDTHIDITAITQADPGVITAAGHGFLNGDEIRFDLIEGMVELNENRYTVADVDTDTFTLLDEEGNPVDTTGFGTYIEGGEVRKLTNEITGLGHLEGETVTVVGDGSPHGEFTVSGAKITLTEKAAVKTAGLPYTGKIRLLPFADGGSTMVRRVYLSNLLLHNTVGGKVGLVGMDKTDIDYGEPAPKAGHPVTLYTGLKEVNFETGNEKDPEVEIIIDQPLPFFILAMVCSSQITEKSKG